MQNHSELLVEAARAGRAEDAKKHLAAGADPNHLECAALRIAVRRGHCEFAGLVAAKADFEKAMRKARQDGDRITLCGLARMQNSPRA